MSPSVGQSYIPISSLHIDLPLPPMTVNNHPMLIRSKTGTTIPRAHFTHLSNDLEPLSVTNALADPKWKEAMQREFHALCKLGTWTLVRKL